MERSYELSGERAPVTSFMPSEALVSLYFGSKDEPKYSPGDVILTPSGRSLQISRIDFAAEGIQYHEVDAPHEIINASLESFFDTEFGEAE